MSKRTADRSAGVDDFTSELLKNLAATTEAHVSRAIANALFVDGPRYDLAIRSCLDAISSIHLIIQNLSYLMSFRGSPGSPTGGRDEQEGVQHP